ncbi:HYR domain-containing protein [Candidatus Nitrosarchaeum limnium]|uniref:HYR domain protein n=1 Tax=Candidatus Nitrosarchaeum limnium BG20 TaxID=859192 RepID=S2E6N5_9ARCH|nr:HYR domain-containing protein [Candidatus Nitrosarchaeum limnium]EPA06850.1 HYR domain protein [Candidatus Nitrosarchaeum limnium BG20]
MKIFLIFSLVLISSIFLPNVFAESYWGNLDVKIEKAERIWGEKADVISVKTKITNNDKERISIYYFYTVLDDDRHREFSTSNYFNLNDKGHTVSEQQCPWESSIELNPGLSDDAKFCFEVPKENLTFTLHLYESSPDYCKNPYFGSCQEKAVRVNVPPPQEPSKTPATKTPSTPSVTNPTSVSNTADISIAKGSSSPGCETTSSCYSPSIMKIGKGSTVTWYNTDSAAHTVTSGTPDKPPTGDFDSSLFMSGKSFSQKFSREGTYPYFCMVHPWMTGTIVVSRGGEVLGNSIKTDLVPPKILQPKDITEKAANGNGIKVSFNVLAIDDNDGNLIPTCNPSSGSLFPIGSTKVTCSVSDSSGNKASPVTFTVTVQSPKTEIPSWVKNIASFWCDGKIDDPSFIEGVQYLITNKIIIVPVISSDGSSSEIPSWIKNNACWWAKNQITDGDFAKGIEFLVKNGIVNVNTSETTQKTTESTQNTSKLQVIKHEASSDPKILTNDQFKKVFTEPDKYKGVWAKLHGEITQEPFISSDGTAYVFDVKEGDSFDITQRIWLYSKSNPGFKENSCLVAEGKIQGKAQATLMLTGASRDIPLVNLEKYNEISCLDAKFPPTTTINVNESQTQGNIKVTLKKIEITPQHTRALIAVENIGNPDGVDFYGHSSAIIQDKKQFKAKLLGLFTVKVPTIESDIPMDVIEEGWVFFEPIESKSFKIMFEGIETSKGWTTQKFSFDINFN